MSPKLLISIVDDEDAAREAIASLVRSFGFTVKVFSSSAGFLASNCRKLTDCLIADVRMPGMSGIALFRVLKASERPIPTILVTAYVDEAVRRSALAEGIKCYLSKPVAADLLLECIHHVLDDR
ncbi:response regulator transcription factor [Sneathiella sp. HT1-7]|uniref:response regulator transcription factor n=1 Tax=Sneathiella sp. HT1-7 TaxID=2887192 RepID=UPI001D13D87D|nr:response regulator [Sneathiella sp. HT1-7]MCC3306214.1 response regulator [Sneathiella sp. HT1-7]